MAETVNGSGGIPREGREKEYATEMWIDDPSAFFLHPEGPLSDTTPEEWIAKQPRRPAPHPMMNAYANADGLLAQSQMYWGLMGQNANYYGRRQHGLLGGVLGF